MIHRNWWIAVGEIASLFGDMRQPIVIWFTLTPDEPADAVKEAA